MTVVKQSFYRWPLGLHANTSSEIRRMNSSGNEWASAFFNPPAATTSTTTGQAFGNLDSFANNTYHDYSTYIEAGGAIAKHKKSDRNFPARLHKMLSNEKHSHVIAWMPHGRAWKVLDKRLLVEEVIPKYFGQTKFPSFTRQLSGWGFKRLLGAGPDFGCYYHECFLRGQPRLTHLMRRIAPGTGRGRSAPNALGEPDFYAISKRFPLREEKSVNSSTETNAQESICSQEAAISSSLPLDHTAPAALSTPRDVISANQSNVQSGSHSMGKTDDETGRMYTTTHSHHYLGGAGSLHGQVESQGRKQGGLAGNNNQQRYQGYQVQHPFPSHLLDSHFYGDPLVLHQMNASINPSSQHQQESISDQHQQRQLQHQQQPRQRASTSTAAISLPNSSSQNSWFETIVAADSSNQLPMSSTQGQSFDNASLFEDSTHHSALDPNGAFWGYNRKT